MAVYKRTYTSYSGPLTPERWRFTILPAYTLRTVFGSRFYSGAFILALVPHLIALLLIYLRSNIDALLTLGIDDATALQVIAIDGGFFLNLFVVETFFAFFMVALLGPGLISPDLANNALPLYFSRPFSRVEYVIGKLSVLLVVTAGITWIPGLVLFLIQTALAGASWSWDNSRILVAILVGSWIWTLTISLMALALSAWVKWRPVAAAALFGIFFVTAGFGTITNVILLTRWGTLLNLASAMRMIWRWLFLQESQYRITSPPFEFMPAWTGLISLLAVCGIALFLLSWKIRPAQVVR
jgi:ABC-2 type transport system permease protein